MEPVTGTSKGKHPCMRLDDSDIKKGNTSLTALDISNGPSLQRCGKHRKMHCLHFHLMVKELCEHCDGLAITHHRDSS